MESEVHLSVSGLLTWPDWNKHAKAVLASAGDTIVLRSIIRKHADSFSALNAWLHNELVRANTEGASELDELVVARNAALMGVSMEKAARFTKEETARRSGP
jgi:hypothetical protein